MAIRDTRAANTGVKLVIVEDMLAADDSKVELGNEIGNDCYDVPVVERPRAIRMAAVTSKGRSIENDASVGHSSLDSS